MYKYLVALILEPDLERMAQKYGSSFIDFSELKTSEQRNRKVPTTNGHLVYMFVEMI